MSFVHLHTHTHYSLLDGLSRPKEVVKVAKDQGSPAIAITDHGVMSGAIDLYKAAKEQDINPILGCEMYVAPEGRLRKEPGLPINHLILLAYNNEGYRNLMELVTKANLEGFYYKPRVDHGLLREFSRGLIALSGCLASEVSQSLLDGNEEKAAETVRLYQEIFGSENYFLEVQDHPELSEQILVNQRLYNLSSHLNVPLVATADSHYTHKEDHDVHDILLCIQMGKTLDQSDRMKFEGDFSLRSPEEMKEAFKDHPSAITNTLEIASRCKVELTFGTNLIPRFETPEQKDPTVYLRELCEEGVRSRYGDAPTKEVMERLDYELGVIHDSGFDAYFLIVRDFVRHAKEVGVIVGPGRGSAAGSLVAYVLEITNVDPLTYGLLFERFLNPARVSMPDIDIDFDDERRNEVLEYVVQKYGRDRVAQIITFGTMAARAAVRDVGRVMGYPYGEVDTIAKLVPPPIQGRHIPLSTSVKEDQMLKKAYEGDARAKALLDNAMRLEGTIRHAGTHACAVIIAQDPLTHNTPLQRSTGSGDENGVITQYSMKPLESLGLLKMDFLGLKNLTIMRNALTAIDRLTGTPFDLEKVDLEDKITFALLTRGETTGVFQLESGGMRRYLRELKPTTFYDIIAMVALYRPGPMAWIPTYIEGKRDPSSISYLHPSFEEILQETNGVAVYQEQILKLARTFAGFSLGEADILRKAVGKKDPKLLAGEREKFIDGAVSQGHKKKFAQEVFKKVIEPFAAYGFNKSHATCYGLIAYQTAYLKAHFPAAFMSALMSSDASNEERIALEVNECQSMDIKVLPPSVNESLGEFTAIDEKTIRFGLRAIKGIGQQPIDSIIEARHKGGPFKSIEDFLKRVSSDVVNKKLIEALSFSGALDELGERNMFAANVNEITAFAKSSQSAAAEGQTDIFGVMDVGDGDDFARLVLRSVKPATRLEKLAWEKQYLGLYVSGHPLQGLKRYLARKVVAIENLNEGRKDKDVMIAGIVSRYKRIVTKRGASMASAEIEDLTGRIPMIIFPKVFQECGGLSEGKVAKVQGRFDERNGEAQFVVKQVKEVSLDVMIENAKEAGTFDPNEPFVIVTKRVEVVPEEEKADGEAAEKGEAAKPGGSKASKAKKGSKKPTKHIIKLTDKMDTSSLEFLKSLLMANQGATPVELHLSLPGKEHVIPLPFGIDLTTELKQRIAEVAK
ncbi:DNA polymerase III subunit alpha [Candidatus Peregrinibacteria bacterium CG_4_9_14_0_2_um_filter_53_11]|nr:MAG: DNA polymerase III subunit alpha [Candidatus Peregrinibacteria bacterium CG_4_9_14_0_2_um_filter_53_11]